MHPSEYDSPTLQLLPGTTPLHPTTDSLLWPSTMLVFNHNPSASPNVIRLRRSKHVQSTIVVKLSSQLIVSGPSLSGPALAQHRRSLGRTRLTADTHATPSFYLRAR